MLDITNRSKLSLAASYEGWGSAGKLHITRNHEDPDRRNSGLYIKVDKKDGYPAFSVDDIPAIQKALQEVWDDFEAAKPTFADKLDAAKPGSFVGYGKDRVPKYVKTTKGWAYIKHTTNDETPTQFWRGKDFDYPDNDWKLLYEAP
jgi:hypothetical protein